MKARLVTRRTPLLEIGYPGFVSGLGVYGIVQLLGERLLGGVLVPVVLLVPLGGWALGARCEPDLTTPRRIVLAAVLAIGCAIVADTARGLYLSVDPTRPAFASIAHPRRAIEMLVFLLFSPIPFAKLGSALGEGVLRSPRPALAWALGSFGVGLGTVAGYGIVAGLGSEEAWLAFAAALTPLLGSRRLSLAVLLACAFSGMWVRSKAPDSLGLAASDRGPGQGQVADLARESRRGSAVPSGGGARPNCAPAPRDTHHAGALVVKLSERLNVRRILYFGFALTRAPVELLASVPRLDRLELVGPEARRVHPTRTESNGLHRSWPDPRVNRVLADPRSYLERVPAPADLVWVNGTDAPSGPKSLLMIPRPAWLFTSDGFRALFRVLGESGVLVVERNAATPDGLSRMLAGAPPGVRSAWVPCPAVATPCAWVGATRSEHSWSALRESLATASGHEPRDLPSTEADRVADDGRPIAIFSHETYAIEAALACAALAALIAARRWWWQVASTEVGWTGPLAGMSFSLAQLATSVSLGRSSAAPGSFEALLFALGWLAASVAGWIVDRCRVGSGSPVRSPLVLASSMTGAALLISIVTLVVVSPFANRDLASTVMVLGCGASALVWMLALEVGDAQRRTIWFEAMLGYALGFAVAPALIAAHGFDLVVLVSGGCTLLAWRGVRAGASRWSTPLLYSPRGVEG